GNSTSNSQSLSAAKHIIYHTNSITSCIHHHDPCRHSSRTTTIYCKDMHNNSVLHHILYYLVTLRTTEVHGLTATGRSTVTSCNQVTLAVRIDTRVTNLLRTGFSQLCRGHIRSSNILTGTHLSSLLSYR